MSADHAQQKQHEYPKNTHTETLLLIAGVEVFFFWTFLLCVGLFPGNATGPLAPISSAIGFAILGLGILEFGIVVLNVQLAWILPDEHDESGVAPFLCGYCLLAQSLLMFPPLIIVAIVFVPLLLISIASVGWYVQKFTCLKLAKPNSLAFQHPLTLRNLLLMPVGLLGLGLLPVSLLLFFGANYFENVVGTSSSFGFVIICSAFGMLSISFLPLVICYLVLFVWQRDRVFQMWAFASTILFFVFAMTVETIASRFTSCVVPLVALAATMFAAGVWTALTPWMKSGLRVVVAKPHPPITSQEYLKFDDLV